MMRQCCGIGPRRDDASCFRAAAAEAVNETNVVFFDFVAYISYGVMFSDWVYSDTGLD